MEEVEVDGVEAEQPQQEVRSERPIKGKIEFQMPDQTSYLKKLELFKNIRFSWLNLPHVPHDKLPNNASTSQIWTRVTKIRNSINYLQDLSLWSKMAVERVISDSLVRELSIVCRSFNAIGVETSGLYQIFYELYWRRCSAKMHRLRLSPDFDLGSWMS